MSDLNRAYSYDDIDVVPEKCVIDSRSKVDTSLTLAGWRFDIPVCPANMKSVVNPRVAGTMSEEGAFYVMHRFFKEGTQGIFDFVVIAQTFRVCSISVGVQKEYFELLTQIKKAGLRLDFVTIDIAHGHAESVKSMISHIRKLFRRKTIIIAGNVASRKGVDFLCDAGADVVKVGIGGGKVCTTRNNTGFHVPMFTCVQDCATPVFELGRPAVIRNIDIIADGGIREFGHYGKAFIAGAKMVMAGSVFAACKDSAAETRLNSKGEYVKLFYGSASSLNKGNDRHVEGIAIELPMSELTVREYIKKVKEHLQSSVSYAGEEKLSNVVGKELTIYANN